MKNVEYGVPQGSVLGPRLFTIMTSELSECTKTGKIEMFADDTDAYCVGNAVDHVICNLQKMLEILRYGVEKIFFQSTLTKQKLWLFKRNNS